MVKKKVAKETTKKSCSKAGSCFLSLVLMAVGFYTVVMGFLYQFILPNVVGSLNFWIPKTSLHWGVLALYFAGFLLISAGKHLKMKAHSCKMD